MIFYVLIYLSPYLFVSIEYSDYSRRLQEFNIFKSYAKADVKPPQYARRRSNHNIDEYLTPLQKKMMMIRVGRDTADVMFSKDWSGFNKKKVAPIRMLTGTLNSNENLSDYDQADDVYSYSDDQNGGYNDEIYGEVNDGDYEYSMEKRNQRSLASEITPRGSMPKSLWVPVLFMTLLIGIIVFAKKVRRRSCKDGKAPLPVNQDEVI